jgi:hypothetical protein
MICEACYGSGKRLNPALIVSTDAHSYTVRVHNPDGLPLLVTCDECHGSGVAHCCDGLRAQPEP